MSDEPTIETVMLCRFLEAANSGEILRWHKAELEKVIELARGAERERCIEALREHLYQCQHNADWMTAHEKDIQILKDLPECPS